jgi:hypothetical protein
VLPVLPPDRLEKVSAVLYAFRLDAGR